MLDRAGQGRTEADGLTDDATRTAVSGARIGRAALQVTLMLAVLGGSYFAMERLAASRPDRTPRVFEPTIYTVETIPVRKADNRPAIHLYGQIDSARSIDLRPLVPGQIVEVHPELAAGRRVSRGDILLRIDPFAYDGAVLEARANLAATEAMIVEIEARLASEREQLAGSDEQLALARSDFERATALAASGAFTSRDVEDRRLIVSQRELAVSQRRNNILIAQAQRMQQAANSERLAWKMREAEQRLADTALLAPFDAVVSEESAEAGRSVSAGDIVAKLYDDRELEARFTLTNAQYGRMATDADPLIGRPVDIVWTVGGIDYRYQAEIDRIGAKVAAERGGVEVFARVAASDYAVELRPGAFVALTVPDRTWPDTVRLPETALHELDHVFVVEDGRLRRQDVRVIAYDGEDALVETDMVDGTEVMITRLTEATDGVLVRAPDDPTVSETPPAGAADTGSPGPGTPRRSTGG